MKWYTPLDEIEDLYRRVNSDNHNVFDAIEQSIWRSGQNLDNLGTLIGLSRADKNKLEYSMSQVPILGGVITARDNWNYVNDYMRNTGNSWDDMPYPSMVRGAGSIGRVGTGAYNYVSDNIRDLYELDSARTTRKLLRQQTSQKRYRW